MDYRVVDISDDPEWFTTFVILVLVPVLYAILQKITGNDDSEQGHALAETDTLAVSNSNHEKEIKPELAAATEALETP